MASWLFPFQMEKLATSGETYLNADVSWSGTGDVVWYTFEFEEPYDATAGQCVGRCVRIFGGAELTIAESSVNFDLPRFTDLVAPTTYTLGDEHLTCPWSA